MAELFGGRFTMKTFEERHAWAILSCQKAQLRLTRVRAAILSFLAQRRMPVTLEMVSQADGIRGGCDEATVYRTLMLFKEAGLVRLVGTPRKASYFVLNVTGDSIHFLICRQCASITELCLSGPLSAEIGRIATAQGFSQTPHDCEIYGLCTQCEVTRKNQIPPSKLMARATDKPMVSKQNCLSQP